MEESKEIVLIVNDGETSCAFYSEMWGDTKKNLSRLYHYGAIKSIELHLEGNALKAAQQDFPRFCTLNKTNKFFGDIALMVIFNSL